MFVTTNTTQNEERNYVKYFTIVSSTIVTSWLTFSHRDKLLPWLGRRRCCRRRRCRCGCWRFCLFFFGFHRHCFRLGCKEKDKTTSLRTISKSCPIGQTNWSFLFGFYSAMILAEFFSPCLLARQTILRSFSFNFELSTLIRAVDLAKKRCQQCCVHWWRSIKE
jgi:hypothetical protein